MIKCCIFDLDGTVLDTITTITHFVNFATGMNKIAPITEDECKYFVGDGARNLIIRTLRSKGISDTGTVEKVFGDYSSAYNANPIYLTQVFAGVTDLLRELKANGIKLILVSNKPDEATQSVVKHFFEGFFDRVSGAVAEFPLKPDPSLAKSILNEFSIAPQECAWIGDTSTDMKTGKNLGVALNIGVLWGFRKREELESSGADVIVEKASEILTEVKRIV